MKPFEVQQPAGPLLDQPAAKAYGTGLDSGIAMSLTSNKVRDWHLQRKSIIYIRQSTPQQVLEHRESAERQYALVDRARLLGWPPDRVKVVDEDQGLSGQSAVGRLGFQYLLAEVGLDHVGIIFGLEMSRLARSNKDWHRNSWNSAPSFAPCSRIKTGAPARRRFVALPPSRRRRNGRGYSIAEPARCPPGFVDQGRGMEGMAGRFAHHFLRRQTA